MKQEYTTKKINGYTFQVNMLPDQSEFRLTWNGCTCLFVKRDGKWIGVQWNCPRIKDVMFHKRVKAYLATI